MEPSAVSPDPLAGSSSRHLSFSCWQQGSFPNPVPVSRGLWVTSGTRIRPARPPARTLACAAPGPEDTIRPHLWGTVMDIATAIALGLLLWLLPLWQYMSSIVCKAPRTALAQRGRLRRCAPPSPCGSAPGIISRKWLVAVQVHGAGAAAPKPSPTCLLSFLRSRTQA